MTAFIIRRLLWTIPVILLVIFLTFVLMRQIEGNPFRTSERAVPESIQRNLERKYGLDEPWYVQYALYVKGVFTFDLGPSLVTRDRTVNDIIKEHFPKSLELGLLAFVWAITLGIPMGVVAALRQNTAYDYTLMFISNVGYAVPSFLVATLLNHAGAAWLGGWVASAMGPDVLRWVIGVSFIAMGVFFSALSDSHLVAGALTFGCALLFLVIGWITPFVGNATVSTLYVPFGNAGTQGVVGATSTRGQGVGSND